MGHVISVIAAVISVIKTAIESKEISRVPQGEWSLIATNKFKPSSSLSDWAACWQAGWLTQLSAQFPWWFPGRKLSTSIHYHRLAWPWTLPYLVNKNLSADFNFIACPGPHTEPTLKPVINLVNVNIIITPQTHHHPLSLHPPITRTACPALIHNL